MADTVIFLNACFTYMPSAELGNFLLARLLRRKGNIRLRRRFGRLHGVSAGGDRIYFMTNLYTMSTIAKNPVVPKAWKQSKFGSTNTSANCLILPV